LAAVAKDAVPPDRELLARLRAQSTEAFAGSVQSLSIGVRKRPMISRAGRWLGAAAAAVLLVGGGLYVFFSLSPSAVAFGKVLENTERADTLHLRVSLPGKHVEFWHTNQPKRSRWDDLAGNYQIADGSKYWIVNEPTNQARQAAPPPEVA